MTAPLVIFDLDGTLVNTAPDLIDSLNHTIAAEGLEPVSFDDVTALVGQGVKVMIERAYALRKTPLSPETAARLFDAFLIHYEGNMPGRSRPYPGMTDCLDRLEAAGMAICVCTNKIEALALTLLKGLGLADRFSVVTGGDTFAVRKPDAGHILGTIERAGGDPATSIMIGDSVNDILAAQNAGIASVAVTFGYSDVPIASLGATVMIDSFDQLTVELVRHALTRNNALRRA